MTELKQYRPIQKSSWFFRLDTIDSYDGWFLIEKCDKDKIDFFGLTSYPYMLGFPGPPKYQKPSEMPPDHSTRITNYTREKPIVFSEIGWASSAVLRGRVRGGAGRVSAMVLGAYKEYANRNCELDLFA
ncbi:MAG: hypothetical protein ACP5KV_01155 [Candidatus Methanomethylicaceae archaeon]